MVLISNYLQYIFAANFHNDGSARAKNHMSCIILFTSTIWIDVEVPINTLLFSITYILSLHYLYYKSNLQIPRVTFSSCPLKTSSKAWQNFIQSIILDRAYLFFITCWLCFTSHHDKHNFIISQDSQYPNHWDPKHYWGIFHFRHIFLN